MSLCVLPTIDAMTNGSDCVLVMVSKNNSTTALRSHQSNNAATKAKDTLDFHNFVQDNARAVMVYLSGKYIGGTSPRLCLFSVMDIEITKT